jgi:hypothetical protein
MTALAEPPAAGALDVRTFLLGDAGPEALREQVEAALSTDGVVGALGASVRRAIGRELADVVAGFLDIDLGEAAVAGWRRHERLQAAARETARTPGLTDRVDLARHTMTNTSKPRVELQRGETPLAHLSLELRLKSTLVGLSATVSGGRLTRPGGGSGEVSAALSMGARTLVERKAPFDAHRSVALGRGIPLLTPGDDLLATPPNSPAPSVVELGGPHPSEKQLGQSPWWIAGRRS